APVCEHRALDLASRLVRHAEVGPRRADRGEVADLLTQTQRAAEVQERPRRATLAEVRVSEHRPRVGLAAAVVRDARLRERAAHETARRVRLAAADRDPRAQSERAAESPAVADGLRLRDGGVEVL